MADPRLGPAAIAMVSMIIGAVAVPLLGSSRTPSQVEPWIPGPTADVRSPSGDLVAMSPPIGPSPSQRPPHHLPRPVRDGAAVDFAASYNLDVQLDDAAGRVHAVERLRLRNVSDDAIGSLNLFVLPNHNASGVNEFALQSITADGRAPAVRWTQSGANLAVTLPAPLAPGATVEVVVAFDLAVGPEVDTIQRAAVSRSHGLMQLLLWYPLLSDGHGTRQSGDPLSATPAADVTYRIRAAGPMVFAVPGEVARRTEREVRGRLEHARDFAFAASPRLRTWTGRAGDATVAVYALPGAAGGVARDVAVDVLDRYGAITGADYPARHFVLVGGTMDMESSGIAFVHRRDLDDAYEVAHEVAHMWFAWLVGSDQLREPWLDEAFATYLAMRLQPRHADGYCSELPVDSPSSAFPDLPLESTWQDCGSYVQTVYWKGSWLLHELRRAMGDRAFASAVREYVATFRFEIATAADLLAVLRRHSDAVTDEVLEAWLAGPPQAYPDARPGGPLQ